MWSKRLICDGKRTNEKQTVMVMLVTVLSGLGAGLGRVQAARTALHANFTRLDIPCTGANQMAS